MRLKHLFILSLACLLGVGTASAVTNHVLKSENLSLALTETSGKLLVYQYFGPTISEGNMNGLFAARSNYTGYTYPALGGYAEGEKALIAEMPDGQLTVDLEMVEIQNTTDAQGQVLVATFKDKVYPLVVKQYFKVYKGTDIFSTWTDITNQGKKDIKLINYASACVPVMRGDNYLTQFHGGWGRESYMSEERIPNGQMVITENDGLRNAFASNPGFMISTDGKPQENRGEVFGGNLIWTGPYKTKITATSNSVSIISGIREDISNYYLTANETFTTPEFLMTISQEGKGGVSRAFHRWALKYGLHGADKTRDILLNSWEGVYMNVNQPVMEQMMTDIAALGGELFVMDDGWFGDKHPRKDDHRGLGDWMVNKEKLPKGIEGLVEAARERNIKFGIWIEPEMANTASELYEKHPDWVLQQQGRPLTQGRGGTQVVLDLCNPKVQDYVFSITDELMTKYPQIAYIKWDCNAPIMNYGSTYLPKNRQSEIYVRYHIGLDNVMKRIRAKYPNLIIQACASGGGRVNYGFLKNFDEFWTSDNTDAIQRLFIHWGDTHFYPAKAMAAHVSASPNHQTRRELPLKFRFDVAMTGRLGMELQPKAMTDAEKAFSKRAIASYKQIRDIVQKGDLYRLVSPYDGGALTSVMYATPDKSKLAFFAYRTTFLYGQAVPNVKLDGVDENRNYRIVDLTPQDEKRPCGLNGQVISGKVLKYAGLSLGGYLNRLYSSLALQLVAE